MIAEVPTRERAQARIERAALELMARKGVHGATTKDIAAKAECSQAVIYKHWKTKEELAERLFAGANEGLLEAMREGADHPDQPAERVLGSLLGLLRYSREHPDRFAYLFQVFHSDYARWLAEREKPRDLILEHLQAAIAEGDVSPETPELKAGLLLGMAVRVAFFERQNLLGTTPGQTETGLLQGAAAVLEA